MHKYIRIVAVLIATMSFLFLILSATRGGKTAKKELMSEQAVCDLLTRFSSEDELSKLMNYYHQTKDIRALLVLAVNTYRPALDEITKKFKSGTIKERKKALYMLRYYALCGDEKAFETIYKGLEDKSSEIKWAAIDSFLHFFILDEENEMRFYKWLTAALKIWSEPEKQRLFFQLTPPTHILEYPYYSNLPYLRELITELEKQDLEELKQALKESSVPIEETRKERLIEEMAEEIKQKRKNLEEDVKRFESALTVLDERGFELDCEKIRELVQDLKKIRSEGAAKATLRFLKHSESCVRLQIVSTLGEYGYKYVPYLLDALGDEDWSVRRSALFSLAKVQCPKLSEVLLKYINDPNEEIKEMTLISLGMLGDPRAITTLQELKNKADTEEAKDFINIRIQSIPIVNVGLSEDIRRCFPKWNQNSQ